MLRHAEYFKDLYGTLIELLNSSRSSKFAKISFNTFRDPREFHPNCTIDIFIALNSVKGRKILNGKYK